MGRRERRNCTYTDQKTMRITSDFLPTNLKMNQMADSFKKLLIKLI